MTEPTTEPRTEAGRALLAATITGAGYDAWRDQILDIETEAREQAWSEREGYRLGFAAGRAAALEEVRAAIMDELTAMPGDNRGVFYDGAAAAYHWVLSRMSACSAEAEEKPDAV